MRRPKVLYVINLNTASGIAVEVAGAIDRNRFDVLTAVYYGDAPGVSFSTSSALIEIGARGKLDGKAMRTMYRVIKSNRPDIIHVHHTLSSAVASITGKLLNVPVLVNTQHHDHHDLSLPQKLLVWPALLLSDLTICNSANTCHSLRWWERIATANRRTIIHNGVNIAWLDRCLSDKNAIRQQYGIGLDDFLIVNVARLVPAKDQASLIKAMTFVVKESPTAKLIIVGDGTMRNELLSLARQLRLQSNVVFTGGLPRETVYALLHSTDLFVMCSRSEGFGNALVEAMAARIPIVASDIETFREIIGEFEHFVQPQQPEALARAILDVASMPPEERQAMGATLRQRALTNYSLKYTVKAYEQAYEDLLQKKTENRS